MSWIPASLISKSTGLRSALRRAGVTKHLSVLRPFLSGANYEERVDQALQSMLREGDVVWDVGANVGLYTERFAQAVGPSGAVVAFEPIATTFEALRSRVEAIPNVAIRMQALGSKLGSVEVTLDADPTSATNTLAQSASSGASTQTVSLTTMDDVLENEGLACPNVVKIDTEGFEEEVIWGMRRALGNPALRAIMIEMHFALLEGQGYRRAPDRICSALLDRGFELTWVDPSHLLARREGSKAGVSARTGSPGA